MFDLGTGARYYGIDCQRRPKPEVFHGTCFVSHLHWDHVQGLPFFPPLLATRQRARHLRTQARGATSRYGDVVDTMLCPPLFPVGVADLPGEIRFHDLLDDVRQIGDVTVTARSIPHIGRHARLPPRVERHLGRLPERPPATRRRRLRDGAAACEELCDGVDLLIHDAQYTPRRVHASKATWGHCTVDYAVWVGKATRCTHRRVVPPRSDCTTTRSLDTRRQELFEALRTERGRRPRRSQAAPRPMNASSMTASTVSVVGTIAAVVLGLVFVVAGASKLAAGERWPAQARDLGAPDLGGDGRAVGRAGRRRAARRAAVRAVAGGRGAWCMLLAFSTLLALRMQDGDRPSCACFGQWSRLRIGVGHLVRNSVFFALWRSLALFA